MYMRQTEQDLGLAANMVAAAEFLFPGRRSKRIRMSRLTFAGTMIFPIRA
jgi:hypothetical protein